MSFITCIEAQTSPISAKAGGMGNIAILPKEVWSSLNNPANWLIGNSLSCGILYQNPALLKELAHKSFIFNKSFKTSNLALATSQMGFSSYQEWSTSLSYGMKLSDDLSLGIKLDYLQLSLDEYYGSKRIITSSIGATYNISDKVQMAAVVINPEQRKLANYQNERLASALIIGLKYELSEKLSLLTENSKEVDGSFASSVGLNYLIHEYFQFRMGYSSLNSISCLGFSISKYSYVLDFAFQYQAYLGLSPQISINYILNRNDDE